MHRCRPTFLCLSLAVVAAGCREESPQAYRAPKESSASAESPAALAPSGQKPPWVVPNGWVEKPSTGGMRVASYRVSADDGRAADISVVALAGTAGGTLENVNRWRGQIGLSPISQDDLSKLSHVARIGDRDAVLYELAGETPTIDGKYKARTLAAVMPAGEMTVFFKMTGEDALVVENKPKFLEWLRSVNTSSEESSATSKPTERSPVAASTASAPASGVASGGAAGLPKWTVPPTWKPAGERPMRLASFAVSGDAGASADMSISMMGGPAGGVLPNVNRWRGQVGLGSWTENELESQATRLELDGARGVVVDFAGDKSLQGEAKKTRILGAIVPRGDQTWFYKLTGDDVLVARERENFVNFVKSAKY